MCACPVKIARHKLKSIYDTVVLHTRSRIHFISVICVLPSFYACSHSQSSSSTLILIRKAFREQVEVVKVHVTCSTQQTLRTYGMREGGGRVDGSHYLIDFVSLDMTPEVDGRMKKQREQVTSTHHTQL